MPAVDLKQRFERVVAATNDKPPEPAFLRIISADLHELGVPDLATAEGQAAMDAVLGDAEVVLGWLRTRGASFVIVPNRPRE